MSSRLTVLFVLIAGCGQGDGGSHPSPPPLSPASAASSAGAHPDATTAPRVETLHVGGSTSNPCARCLAVVGNRVYWTSAGDVSLQVDDRKHDFEQLAAMQAASAGIAADGAGVIWIDADDGSVMEPNDQGGPPQYIAKLGAGTISGVALTPDAIVAAHDDTVVTLPRAGGKPRVIATHASGPIAVGGGRVYFIGVDHDVSSHQVSSVALNGGAVTKIGAPLAEDPPLMELAAGRLYLTEPKAGVVGSIATDGSEHELHVLVKGEPLPTGLAVHGDTVYFTSAVARVGTIKRVARSGGTPATIAASEDAPSAVAVGDAGVYWLTGTGELRRFATTP